MKTYIKFLVQVFLKSFLNIFLILLSLVFILNILTEIEFFKNTNVNSFYDLLEIAQRDNSVLIYASSAATYGSLPSPQVVGNENPENPYGYSKLLMDQIAIRYLTENPHMKIIGLRFFTIYGPWGRPDMMIMKYLIASKKDKDFLLFNRGDHFRDFTYIDDAINICE